jgi:murein hydrolase activator
MMSTDGAAMACIRYCLLSHQIKYSRVVRSLLSSLFSTPARSLVAVIALIAAFDLFTAVVPAQTASQNRDLARDAATRMRELQAEADRLAAETGTILTELRKLEIGRQIKAQELAKADAELKGVETALSEASARVAALDAERLAETPWVRERLVELYKRRQGGYLRLLLGTRDLRELGRLSRGVAAVARLDRVRLESHRRLIRDEQAGARDLERRRADVQGARAAAAAARQALDLAVAAHNRRLDDLDQRRDLAARYIGELQTAQGELQRTVASLGTSTAALPIEPFRGMLEWPAQGQLLTRFGRSIAGRFGTAIVRNGVEIAAIEGTPVRAVHAGTVAFAAPFSGYGTLVIVDHGRNTFTLYGHLSQAAVTTGTAVTKGGVVGRSGRSPAGTAAVYFELRIDGRPVDPVQWLRSTK